MPNQYTKPIPAEKRFWEKVDKSAGPDGCWLWIAGHGRYGVFAPGVNHHSCSAHRFSYELAFGPIPNGLDCLHKCDVPLCVNPKHLFLGTQTDNAHDAMKKGRLAKGIKSGSFTHPEKRHKGNDHWQRLHPEKAARGERQGSSKLTSEQVLQIRAMYGVNGENSSTLAKQFGVSSTNIRYIVRRQSWKHI